MLVSPPEMAAISQLVKNLCGVNLDQSKTYLVESRLTNVAEEAGCATFGALCDKVRNSNDRGLLNRIVDAITTNETLFFRDPTTFQALQHKVLPDLINARSRTRFPKRLRIWSAACSTGQETYSIAMVVSELIPNPKTWDIAIIGTDISESAINQASLGIFGNHEIDRGMPPAMLSKYFDQQGNTWKVKDNLRALTSFRRQNILEPFLGMGTSDIIFCRNVAIYFDDQAKKSLFRRLNGALAVDGYLFVGASEVLGALGPEFVSENHCRATFYRPVDGELCWNNLPEVLAGEDLEIPPEAYF